VDPDGFFGNWIIVPFLVCLIEDLNANALMCENRHRKAAIS